MARSPSPAKAKAKKQQENPVAPAVKSSSHAPMNQDLVGVTLDGKFRFTVPDTPTTLEAMAKFYSLPSIVTFACFGVSAYFAQLRFSGEIIVGLAIFWRLMYDVVGGACVPMWVVVSSYITKC
jgi:hypothetical protein